MNERQWRLVDAAQKVGTKAFDDHQDLWYVSNGPAPVGEGWTQVSLQAALAAAAVRVDEMVRREMAEAMRADGIEDV
jgi:hypothetical protein